MTFSCPSVWGFGKSRRGPLTLKTNYSMGKIVSHTLRAQAPYQLSDNALPAREDNRPVIVYKREYHSCNGGQLT